MRLLRKTLLLDNAYNTAYTALCSLAGVAELVDAPDSKSGDGDIVWVRVPLSVFGDRVPVIRFQNLSINSRHQYSLQILFDPTTDNRQPTADN